MKKFFSAFLIVFLISFFSTFAMVFIMFNIAPSIEGDGAWIDYLPLIPVGLLTVWQIFGAYKDYQQGYKEDAVYRILGIVVAIFVWFFSCGRFILQV